MHTNESRTVQVHRKKTLNHFELSVLHDHHAKE